MTGRKEPARQTANNSRLLALLCVLWVFSGGRALALDSPDHSWWLLGGYGQSIPGWGLTTERVETIDLVGRYHHLTIANLGDGWYRGFHSTLVEVPLHLVLSPDESAMVGINLMACYTFTAPQHWRPYLFGGGGPVYSWADIDGMGAELNGNYQFGVGVEMPLNERQRFLVEYRFHHISNAGTRSPNVPLNSSKILIGIRF